MPRPTKTLSEPPVLPKMKKGVRIKAVPKRVGYAVATDGSTRSCMAVWPRGRFAKRWRKTRGSRCRAGYRTVQLCRIGKPKRVKVSRLVLLVFVGRPKRGQEACHRNGNESDDRLRNLRWGTRQSNIEDKRRHGTWPSGESHPSAILTGKQVAEIRSIYRFRGGGRSAVSLAKTYGVCRQTILDVVHRRKWAHL